MHDNPRQLQCRDRPPGRQERNCVICRGPHWASQCPENQGKPSEKEDETMAVNIETSLFAKEALETKMVLVDGAPPSHWGHGRRWTHE